MQGRLPENRLGSLTEQTANSGQVSSVGERRELGLVW
jgi:hypothetical protein